MAKTFKRELLEKVAAELNEVFGLNPPIQADMDDDTLLTTVVYEAIGKGIVNDALRADDFVTANPEKKTFSKEAHEFFIAAGVWDAKAQKVIMPTEYCAQPEEGEAEAQTEMEAGEETDTDVDPLDAAVRAAKTKKSEKLAPAAAARKANKSKAKAVPAKPAAAEKEEPKVTTTKAVRAAVTKKTATAKKRAAKTTKAVKAPAKAKAAPANLDAYGFREGSTTSKAIAFLAAGKHTMAEAKAKFGGTFYSSLKKIAATGGKVIANDNSTFTITTKK